MAANKTVRVFVRALRWAMATAIAALSPSAPAAEPSAAPSAPATEANDARGPLASAAPAANSSIADDDVFAPDPSRLKVVSITTRMSGYNQYGTGYQSKSGPPLGPGSERLTVFEPQVEVVATQGDRITHRVWVPIDVISAASPSQIPRVPDVVSGASRHNIGGTLQWSILYKADRATEYATTTGLHLEEPFRSWNGGLGFKQALADQNTIVAANVAGIFDWFDRFFTSGVREGRTERSTTMASAGVTQVLSPTTIANVNYGFTLQEGELGNTWNEVPLSNGTRGPEILPRERVRHALVGRMSQFLPWNGALRLYYRFYADDWGIVAHSAEGQLMQRLTPLLYVRMLYRFHTQTEPPFFTTLAKPDGTLRVADSDLAALDSHTVGAKVVGDAPVRGVARVLHFEVEYDRYVRTNDLRIDIVTCALGLRF